VDFLLTAKRDRKAAARFLRKAIDQCATPKKITIDKSGANTAAIEQYNTDNQASIELRQVKYLNNIVEQDHRAIKRMTRPMLGFKSFWSACHYARRDRTHAHDPQRPTEGPCQIASSAAILFVGRLSRFIMADPARPFTNFATER
jgi:putative transposase